MVFAEITVVACSIDLIYQNTFGIMPCTLLITVHGIYKNGILIVCIKGQLFQSCMSFFIYADIIFCAKFHW